MTDKAIEAIRKEIVALTAENLAMQFVLTSLLQRISEGSPSMRRLILQALDEAVEPYRELQHCPRREGRLPS
jgi:hypothetical protein